MKIDKRFDEKMKRLRELWDRLNYDIPMAENKLLSVRLGTPMQWEIEGGAASLEWLMRPDCQFIDVFQIEVWKILDAEIRFCESLLDDAALRINKTTHVKYIHCLENIQDNKLYPISELAAAIGPGCSRDAVRYWIRVGRKVDGKSSKPIFLKPDKIVSGERTVKGSDLKKFFEKIDFFHDQEEKNFS